MADPLNRVNVTQIDAPFPEQWREELYTFAREIGAIKDSLDVLNTNIQKSSEVSNRLAEWYTEGGKSPLASLPSDIAEQYAQQRALNEFGAPEGASNEGALRAALSQQAQQAGTTPSSGGASKPPNTQEKREGLEGWLEKTPIALPQHYGGTYTAADIAALGAHFANWRLGNAETPEGEDKWASVGDKFKSAATEGIPTAQAVLGLGKNYYNKAQSMSQGLASYSSALGFQPGEGFSLGPLGSSNDISIAGLNFRPPLINSTALSGIKQGISAFGASFNTPGLSPGAVMSLEEGVAARGWQENGGLSPQGQEIYDVQAKLFGKGGVFQQMSENPGVMDLLDKATRSGTKNIQEMTKAIEAIPSAAEEANVSVEQMAADMNAYGEMSQQQGGSHAAGQEQAKQVAQLLGMAPSAVEGIFNSPFIQGKIFQSTGVPTFMQGTLPGGVKNQLMVKAVREMANMVGPQKGHTVQGLGGFEYHVSGQDEQVALMKAMGLEANPEVIKKILNENPHRIQVQGQLSKSAQAWQQTTLELLQNPGAQKVGSHQWQKAEEALTATVSGNHNFGQLLRTMGEQRTEDGKRMFSREDIKNIRTNFGEGYSQHGAELVKAKFESVQKVLGTKGEKDSNRTGSPNHQLTIDLSPAAKKILRLPNKKSTMKLEANAGEGKPMNASASGFTNDPVPNFSSDNGELLWENPTTGQLYTER